MSKKSVFKVKNPECAGNGHYDYLILFGGGGDVGIHNGCLTSNKNYNNFGLNYQGVNDKGYTDKENKTYLGGIEIYTVKGIECFHLK